MNNIMPTVPLVPLKTKFCGLHETRHTQPNST